MLSINSRFFCVGFALEERTLTPGYPQDTTLLSSQRPTPNRVYGYEDGLNSAVTGSGPKTNLGRWNRFRKGHLLSYRVSPSPILFKPAKYIRRTRPLRSPLAPRTPFFPGGARTIHNGLRFPRGWGKILFPSDLGRINLSNIWCVVAKNCHRASNTRELYPKAHSSSYKMICWSLQCTLFVMHRLRVLLREGHRMSTRTSSHVNMCVTGAKGR